MKKISRVLAAILASVLLISTFIYDLSVQVLAVDYHSTADYNRLRKIHQSDMSNTAINTSIEFITREDTAIKPKDRSQGRGLNPFAYNNYNKKVVYGCPHGEFAAGQGGTMVNFDDGRRGEYKFLGYNYDGVAVTNDLFIRPGASGWLPTKESYLQTNMGWKDVNGAENTWNNLEHSYIEKYLRETNFEDSDYSGPGSPYPGINLNYIFSNNFSLMKDKAYVQLSPSVWYRSGSVRLEYKKANGDPGWNTVNYQPMYPDTDVSLTMTIDPNQSMYVLNAEDDELKIKVNIQGKITGKIVNENKLSLLEKFILQFEQDTQSFDITGTTYTHSFTKTISRSNLSVGTNQIELELKGYAKIKSRIYGESVYTANPITKIITVEVKPKTDSYVSAILNAKPQSIIYKDIDMKTTLTADFSLENFKDTTKVSGVRVNFVGIGIFELPGMLKGSHSVDTIIPKSIMDGKNSAVKKYEVLVTYNMADGTNKYGAAAIVVDISRGKPPKPNTAPEMRLAVPRQVRAGDIFTAWINASDPDGDQLYYDLRYSPARVETLNPDNKGGTFWYDKNYVGTIQEIYGAVNDDSFTVDDTKYIAVTEPIVNARMSISGTLKENRKVIINDTSDTPDKYAVTNRKWTIEPILTSGTTADDIKYVTLTGVSIDALFKKAGQYKITLEVTNAAGYSDISIQTITIGKDENPIGTLEIPEEIYRDPSTGKATLKGFITFASTDNDLKWFISAYYRFDSENDGNFNNNAWVQFSGVDFDKEFTLQLNSIGKYQVRVNIHEKYGQPTIPEFITDPLTTSNWIDYRYTTIDKTFEVKNVAPEFSFNNTVKKKADIKIDVMPDGYTLQQVKSRVNAVLAPILATNSVNANIEVKHAPRVNIYDSYFIASVSPTNNRVLNLFEDYKMTGNFTKIAELPLPEPQEMAASGIFSKYTGYYGHSSGKYKNSFADDLYVGKEGIYYTTWNYKSYSVPRWNTSKEIYYESIPSGKNLYYYDYNTKNITLVTDLLEDMDNPGMITIMPDGSIAWVTNTTSTKTIKKWDPLTKQLSTLYSSPKLIYSLYYSGTNLLFNQLEITWYVRYSGNYRYAYHKYSMNTYRLEGASVLFHVETFSFIDDYNYFNYHWEDSHLRPPLPGYNSYEYYRFLGSQLTTLGFVGNFGIDSTNNIYRFVSKKTDRDDYYDDNYCLSNLVTNKQSLGQNNKFIPFENNIWMASGSDVWTDMEPYQSRLVIVKNARNKFILHWPTGTTHSWYFQLTDKNLPVVSAPLKGMYLMQGTATKLTTSKIIYEPYSYYWSENKTTYTYDQDKIIDVSSNINISSGNTTNTLCYTNYPSNIEFQNSFDTTLYLKTLNIGLELASFEENSEKFYITVDSAVNPSMADTSLRSKIVSNLVSNNINYIPMGTTINSANLTLLSTQNINGGGKGKFINVSNLDQALTSLGQAVIDSVTEEKPNKDTYLVVGETISTELFYTDYENDPKNGHRFIYTHDSKYFENSQGSDTDSGKYITVLPTTFDKVGKYVLQASAQDIPLTDSRFANYRLWGEPEIKNIYVHRAPVPVPVVNITNRGTYFSVNQYSNSYDLDHISQPNKGIRQTKWWYKSNTDSDWISGMLPSTIPLNKTYEVKIEVLDEEFTSATKIITVPDNKPIALFQLKKSPIEITYSLVVNTDIIDNSFDPMGSSITQRLWTVRKSGVLVYEGATPKVYYGDKGIGDYEITLTVKNSLGLWSDPYTQILTVTRDLTAPTINISPISREWNKTNVSVNVSAADAGGISHIKYAWSKDPINPDTAFTSIYSSTINANQSEEGEWYLFAQAIDNYTNSSKMLVGGPYKVDKTASILEEIQIYNETFKEDNTYWIKGGQIVDVRLRAKEQLSGLSQSRLVLASDKSGASHDWNGSTTNFSLLGSTSKIRVTAAAESLENHINGLYETKYLVEGVSDFVDDLQYFFSDNATNETGYVNSGLKLGVDNKAPTITVTPENRSLSKLDAVATIKAEDVGSGVNRIEYAISSSDAYPTSGIWTTTYGELANAIMNTSGVWYLHIEAFDNVGNRSYIVKGPYSVDNEGPEITINPESLSWVNIIPTISIRATEKMSDFKDLRYMITDNDLRPDEMYNNITSKDSATVDILEDGIWYLPVEAEDSLGNISYKLGGAYHLDRVKPTVIFTPSERHIIGSEAETAEIPVNIKVTDDRSGVQSATLRMIYTPYTPTGFGAPQLTQTTIVNYSGHSIILSNMGKYELIVDARDRAGNTITKIGNYSLVPNNAPEVKILGTSPSYLYEGDNLVVNFRATDPDLDKLTCNLEIKKGSTMIWSGSKTVMPSGGIYSAVSLPTIQNIDTGSYTVSITAKDPQNVAATDTHIFNVHALEVTGSVSHTELWEQHRQKYNAAARAAGREEHAPEDFFEGEMFVVSADTTEINPLSNVTALNVQVGIIGTSFSTYLEKTSSSRFHKGWWEESMPRWGVRPIDFLFRVAYSNGTVKTHTVRIFMTADEYWRLHLLF